MLFRPAGTDVNPREKITRWTIFRAVFDDGTTSDHLVGTAGGYGRASSPIQAFDKDAGTVTTRSGRVYELCGNPGMSMDAAYVWGNWCEVNGVKTAEDVSSEYVKITPTEFKEKD